MVEAASTHPGVVVATCKEVDINKDKTGNAFLQMATSVKDVRKKAIT